MDYNTTSWSNDELLSQVAQAVESHWLREENLQLKRALKQRFNFPNIIGKSDKMLTLFDLVAQVGPSRSTVLISGRAHGKRIDCQGDSFGFAARRPRLCSCEYGLHTGGPAGIPIVRTR